MTKTLLIFAHSNPEKSVQNMKLINEAKQDPSITILNLHEKYHAQHFILTEDQIKHDSALLLSHDKIIFQYPMYFANMPPCARAW
jgi:putative NADPH-quinone reductase